MRAIIKRVFFLASVFILFILSACEKNSIHLKKNNREEVNNNTNVVISHKGYAKAPILIANKVWFIDDNGADNIYLVMGETKAMLIDTGTGDADLLSLVKALTELPIVVINTHGHPDHAGGNYSFDKVYAHPADFNAIRKFGSRGNHVELLALKDGDCIDLGNRKIEVIETPGHTYGSICLLDKKYKILFTGDTCNVFSWLFIKESAPLETYLDSLQKIKSHSKEFMSIMPGHGTSLDNSFIDELIECTKNILDGDTGRPYHTFAGDGMLCSYKRASIIFNPDNLKRKTGND